MVSLGTQPRSQRSRWHERPSKHPSNKDNSNRDRLHVVQYLVVTLGDARQSTPTIFKTLNPEWNVSFEMPVVGVPLLEAICWDHDRFGKDYLGEFDIALEDIFADGQVNQPVGEGTRCSDNWWLVLT